MKLTAPDILLQIESIDPCESRIMVKLDPDSLSDDVLTALQLAAQPRGESGDDFRGWLQECVVRERGRRAANDENHTPIESNVWKMPWHTWPDDELSAALAASFSWTTMGVSAEAARAFRIIHQSIVTICCTRLREISDAIEIARRRG